MGKKTNGVFHAQQSNAPRSRQHVFPPFNLRAEMSRRQSVSARLGRVSEESAEFFERVNAVLQKQENMLRAAQAEVTPTRLPPFHLLVI